MGDQICMQCRRSALTRALYNGISVSYLYWKYLTWCIFIFASFMAITYWWSMVIFWLTRRLFFSPNSAISNTHPTRYHHHGHWLVTWAHEGSVLRSPSLSCRTTILLAIQLLYMWINRKLKAFSSVTRLLSSHFPSALVANFSIVICALEETTHKGCVRKWELFSFFSICLPWYYFFWHLFQEVFASSLFSLLLVFNLFIDLFFLFLLPLCSHNSLSRWSH